MDSTSSRFVGKLFPDGHDANKQGGHPIHLTATWDLRPIHICVPTALQNANFTSCGATNTHRASDFGDRCRRSYFTSSISPGRQVNNAERA